MMRVLFILKKNETYGFTTYCRRSSGLWNSTRYIVEAMAARGIHAGIVEVNDNNDIDREVRKFKATLVIIEALWVVPSKFDVLKPLHPGVKWVVHLHSHMPFLSLEGIAIEWCLDYVKKDVGVIANSPESYEALLPILGRKHLAYLPNVYLPKLTSQKGLDREVLDIGCFGAIRPLKNQLLQALAALKFADSEKKYLRFHMNTSRVETGGQPVLKNIRTLFEHAKAAELVEVDWLEPEDFATYLQKMHLSMQVSLSETFNVVTADAVSNGVPVVVSKEIKWASKLCRSHDDSIGSIIETMHRVYRRRALIGWNQRLLCKYSEASQKMWFKYLHLSHKPKAQ